MVVGDRAADGSTRYSMLETLRAYARERLDETDDADRWRRRHAEHYAEFAEHAGSGLEGPDEFVWRERVRAELDNLRAAIGWALDSTPTADAQLGLRIVAALAYAAVIDMTSGVGAWTERAVPRADETTPGRRTAILGRRGDPGHLRRRPRSGRRPWRSTRCATVSRPTARFPSRPTPRSRVFELNNGRPDEALRVIQRGLHDLEAIVGRRRVQGERVPFHRRGVLDATAATSRPPAPKPTKRSGWRVRSAIRPRRRRPCGRRARP